MDILEKFESLKNGGEVQFKLIEGDSTDSELDINGENLKIEELEGGLVHNVSWYRGPELISSWYRNALQSSNANYVRVYFCTNDGGIITERISCTVGSLLSSLSSECNEKDVLDIFLQIIRILPQVETKFGAGAGGDSLDQLYIVKAQESEISPQRKFYLKIGWLFDTTINVNWIDKFKLLMNKFYGSRKLYISKANWDIQYFETALASGDEIRELALHLHPAFMRPEQKRFFVVKYLQLVSKYNNEKVAHDKSTFDYFIRGLDTASLVYEHKSFRDEIKPGHDWYAYFKDFNFFARQSDMVGVDVYLFLKQWRHLMQHQQTENRVVGIEKFTDLDFAQHLDIFCPGILSIFFSKLFRGSLKEEAKRNWIIDFALDS